MVVVWFELARAYVPLVVEEVVVVRPAPHYSLSVAEVEAERSHRLRQPVGEAAAEVERYRRIL